MVAGCNIYEVENKNPVEIYVDTENEKIRIQDSIRDAKYNKHIYYYNLCISHWEKSMNAKLSGNVKTDKRHWKLFLAYQDSMINYTN
jgi:hypothetical protein